MEPDEVAAVEDVLRSQLGWSARWRLYDRELNTPMNFVLKRAEAHLGSKFRVYWVEDAPPEVFCLQGFSEAVTIFSTRYTELWADARAILASSVFGPELLPRIAEQLSLRLIAELSLSKDDPEFAACAMLRSTMAGEGLFHLPNTIGGLEQEPIATPYMACWFYGLAHELGHFASFALDSNTTGVLRDEVILAALETAYGGLRPELREEARAGAVSDRRGFILGLDNLRSEGSADIFATSLLLESTIEIMQLINGQPREPNSSQGFDLVSFIAEMFISLNVVALIDRCRRVAVQACTATPNRQHRVEAVLHPVAVKVRLMMVRWYLRHASLVYLFGDHATSEQEDRVSAAVDDVLEGLRPAITAAEQGLEQAMVFSLDRERRPLFLELLQSWGRTRDTSGGIEQMEVERFCSLAGSLGKSSPVFDTMLAVARNPSAPIEMKVNQGSPYLCPWVTGPNNFNRPFGLDTRHGHIVFIFRSDGELYRKYRDISAESLAAGYAMETTIIAADTEQQVRDAVALRLPLDEQFQIVLEGTEGFDRCMKELVEGTIWLDPNTPDDAGGATVA